jgi:hypothetical protein
LDSLSLALIRLEIRIQQQALETSAFPVGPFDGAGLYCFQRCRFVSAGERC